MSEKQPRLVQATPEQVALNQLFKQQEHVIHHLKEIQKNTSSMKNYLMFFVLLSLFSIIIAACNVLMNY